MHHVIISLAANRFQKKNLSKARHCLEEILSDIHITTEHWTTPIGNSPRHDAYLNQLVAGQTPLDEKSLTEWLKQTEVNFGRTEAKKRLGIVPIDLDLMLFDGQRRHERDWERPYIKCLITEITDTK
jgi:2-amino-4-hydroxy-6-hydroxymethyldihydropteridine diphosphokinase